MLARLTLPLALVCVLALSASPAGAVVILGTGTGALLDSDLTDPENNGAPDADVGYNATFFASEEPSFGGGENAFNVFDNLVGGGNNKWCCGDQNNFPANPIFVGAIFDDQIELTHFTLTSGNDTPDRDPRIWAIEGSNDGSIWTSIFSQNDPNASLWTARDQVLLFDSTDFDAPGAFNQYRFITTATGLTSGARFQLNEIELFGNVVPEPATAMFGLLSLGALALRRRRVA